MNPLGWQNLTEVLVFAAQSPGIGFKGDWHHRNISTGGEFDTQGVESVGVEGGTARRLRKDDDGNAISQPSLALFKDGPEVLTGIVASDHDRLAAAHNVLEKGIVDQAFLDHESHVAVGLNQAGQNKRLQDTHVVADKHAGGIDLTEHMRIFDFKTSADRLEGFNGFVAAFDPLSVIVSVSFGQAGCCDDDQHHFGVEKRCGVSAC